jgi:2'-5' RNA ligase
LGDINQTMLNSVLEGMARAAQEFPPFQLGLEGLGVFPNNRQPRVLWAGAQGDLDSLSQLQERVEREITPLGFAPERCGYNPHLTLGRVRDNISANQRGKLGEIFLGQSLVPSEGWLAQEIHLIQSIIRPGQANYYPFIGSAPLTG